MTTKLDVNWQLNSGKCPEHGGEIRNIYSFGKYRDADVYTFKGCNGAVAQPYDPVGQYPYQPVYTTSYDEAACIARFAKAMQAKYN